MSQPRKGGRPRKAPAEKYRTPARQLGRVDDETWELLQKAASEAGTSFTDWAVTVLRNAAKRQLSTPRSPRG